MKTFTTLTAVAALIAGMAIANAQNPGGPAGSNASPSNINKGSDPSTPAGKQSGNQSSGSAMQSGASKDRVTGTAKFCIQAQASTGGLECKFASMAACEKEGKPLNRQCSPNPNIGTTGSR